MQQLRVPYRSRGRDLSHAVHCAHSWLPRHRDETVRHHVVSIVDDDNDDDDNDDDDDDNDDDHMLGIALAFDRRRRASRRTRCTTSSTRIKSSRLPKRSVHHRRYHTYTYNRMHTHTYYMRMCITNLFDNRPCRGRPTPCRTSSTSSRAR